jgi:DNA-binding transcriptional MerR regulator
MIRRMPKHEERRAGLRIHEFAKRTGLTVRTLHHYDRLGLLKPRRSRHGYRVYRETDAARVDEISVLKFLGLSLTDIKSALGNDRRRAELLTLQRYSLGHRRQLLAAAIEMLGQIERGSFDWADLAGFARELGGHADPQTGWRNRRLVEARRKLATRRLAWDATLADYELNRDVRAAIARGETPDTPAGQALVARWRDSIERFTGGDAALKEALAVVMRDRANHPHPASSSADTYSEYIFRALQQAS